MLLNITYPKRNPTRGYNLRELLWCSQKTDFFEKVNFDFKV